MSAVSIRHLSFSLLQRLLNKKSTISNMQSSSNVMARGISYYANNLVKTLVIANNFILMMTYAEARLIPENLKTAATTYLRVLLVKALNFFRKINFM